MALVHVVSQGSDPQRLLLLVHGYGADEADLSALLQYLDPDGRCTTVLPRGPLQAPGTPGYAWYDFADPQVTAQGFEAARAQLDDLLDEQCAALGFDRAQAIVGGFSQGGGLALAVGLGRSDRVRPAAVLAMSPAVPTDDQIGRAHV